MMEGLYLHFPFCASRCAYCDFYSTVEDAEMREKYVGALCNEIEGRARFLSGGPLGSVYLGGGTPSQFSPWQLERVFDVIGCNFVISQDAEITIEVNPDDVTPDFLEGLALLPINRVSMGIQTLDDGLLRLLNRRHTAEQARRAVERLLKAGYQNLSVDLIYGLPHQRLQDWARDVAEALSMPVKHLSAYALSYEKGTQLDRMRREGRVSEADEELSRQMYLLLLDMTAREGWEHYEISNFCRPGFRARHNSGYWQGMHYLGCGPGAHSYDGRARRWNLPRLRAYVAAGGHTESNGLSEQETLTPTMRANEMVMTALRTREGLLLRDYERQFGPEERQALLLRAQGPLERGWLRLDGEGQRLVLTREGLFVSDGVMVDLLQDD